MSTATASAIPSPELRRSTHPAPAARTEAATKVYGDGDTAVRALNDVTVELAAGRFTAIMGPSGSGSPR